MDGQEYYKDGAERLIDLMRDTFGDYFKEYFNGEPEGIPETMLPCMMFVTPRLRVVTGATGTDDIEETVTIIVALNKRDDFGADTNDNLTMRRLRKLIIGQDPAGGDDSIAPYMQQTIMQALRQFISLESSTTRNEVEVDFDVNVRGAESATLEAYITVRLYRQALVVERQ